MYLATVDVQASAIRSPAGIDTHSRVYILAAETRVPEKSRINSKRAQTVKWQQARVLR